MIPGKKKKKPVLDYKKVIQYETFIIVGVIMAIFAFLNAIKAINISSDYFWMLAGIGLVIEGFLARHKLRKENKVLLEKDRKFLRKNKVKWF